MSAKRIHRWGLVSMIAVTAACEIERPPALRQALASGTNVAAAGRVVTAERADGGESAGLSASPAGSTAMDPATSDEPRTGAAAPDQQEVPGSSTGADESEAAAAADPASSPARAYGEGARPAADRFPRPRAIRGLYVNAWAAGSASRMEQLLDLARRTEVNSLVIDIKDASGYVSHRTEVALAHEIGATGEIRIRDLPGLLARLEREGIYPIARIVLVKDPILAEFRPELAVNDTAGGVWVDSKGLVWMDPYAREVWDYHLALAREVALLGFPEIQYDYVRFPDAPEDDLARAVFPAADGRSKPTVIRDLLADARDSLADIDVRLTADVFGVTTSARRDVGIGQVWESFIGAVDAALPMVYPSHYWEGSFGFQAPNAHPYEVVGRALRDALGRSSQVEGAGRTIPWLQDFSLGQPSYGSAEVRAQIQATYDAGVDEWILWNPGSRYTEMALQPAEGFEREPYIRVANRLVPVSERWAVLDSVTTARARADSLRATRAAEGASAAAAPAPVPAAEASVADTVGARRD
jgi:hypothetical protein